MDRATLKFLGVKSAHDWRARKRRQIRAVEKAANILLLGSAFTPIGTETIPLLGTLRAMKKKLSVENWGK